MIPPPLDGLVPLLDDFKNKATYTFTIRTDSDKRLFVTVFLTDSLVDDSTKVEIELPILLQLTLPPVLSGTFKYTPIPYMAWNGSFRSKYMPLRL